MTRHHLPASLVAGALLLSLARPAAAQVGRVNGFVRSEDGQLLKGATITAENSDTGQSLTATSDEKGRFVMLGLRTGVWTFIAQAPGFSAQMGDSMIRSGGQNAVIGFSLKKRGAANFGALAGIAAKDLQTDLASADALFKEGRWDEAIASYRGVLAKAAPLSALNLQIALAYRNKNDIAGALAAYNELLKADPGNERAAVGIAMTYLEHGNAPSAKAKLLEVVQGGHAGREVLFALGEVESAGGDAREAVKWFQRAADADTSWGKPLYKLGLGATQSGDKAEARTFFSQVLRVDPTSPEAELARNALDSLDK